MPTIGNTLTDDARAKLASLTSDAPTPAKARTKAKAPTKAKAVATKVKAVARAGFAKVTTGGPAKALIAEAGRQYAKWRAAVGAGKFPATNESSNPRFPMQVVGAVWGFANGADGRATVEAMQAYLHGLKGHSLRPTASGSYIGGSMSIMDYTKADYPKRVKSLGPTLATGYIARKQADGMYRLVALKPSERANVAAWTGAKAKATRNVKPTPAAKASLRTKLANARKANAGTRPGTVTVKRASKAAQRAYNAQTASTKANGPAAAREAALSDIKATAGQ